MRAWSWIGYAVLAGVMLAGVASASSDVSASRSGADFLRSGASDGAGGLDFRGADLSYHDFSGANLDGADFRGADLFRAVFTHASVVDADLRWTRLKWAQFDHADLRWSRFEQADLRHASLLEADLREGNLRGVNLKSADLRGADLRFANLSKMLWNGQTRFEGALFNAETLFPDEFEPLDAGMVAPEPSTGLMVGMGLIGLALCGRSRGDQVV